MLQRQVTYFAFKPYIRKSQKLFAPFMVLLVLVSPALLLARSDSTSHSTMSSGLSVAGPLPHPLPLSCPPSPKHDFWATQAILSNFRFWKKKKLTHTSNFFFIQNFFSPNFFSSKIFFSPKSFFHPKFFFIQFFFHPKFFFMQFFFHPKFFFIQFFFHLQKIFPTFTF